MGTWVISMESPNGDTFDQTLAIWSEEGKVAAFYDGPLWVPVDRGRGVPIITDVSKDGDNLTLTLGSRTPRHGSTASLIDSPLSTPPPS